MRCEVTIPIIVKSFSFNVKLSIFRPVHDSMSNPALFDKKHGVQMGVPADGCDDAKVRKTFFFSVYLNYNNSSKFKFS